MDKTWKIVVDQSHVGDHAACQQYHNILHRTMRETVLHINRSLGTIYCSVVCSILHIKPTVGHVASV